MIITSTANPIVKHIASLKEAKYRKMSGEFLLEGKRLVDDYLNSPELMVKFRLKYLIVREDCAGGYNGATIVGSSVFEKISDTVNSQGILAVLSRPENAMEKKSGNFLILDGISDPGNMGAILRTAAATDFLEVFAIGCTDAFSPKAVRASMGGVLYVDYHECGRDIVDNFDGSILLAADMDGEDIFRISLPDCNRVGLIIGSEASGIGTDLIGKARKISLPMKRVESLNASVAASVLMYTIANKTRGV